MAHRDDQRVTALIDALLRSHWPVCEQLADALAQIGTEQARQGLIRALRARRHHIRSAAVKALVRLGPERLREHLAALADDPSYEVRQDVKDALADISAQSHTPRN